jgi:hypothetical protein
MRTPPFRPSPSYSNARVIAREASGPVVFESFEVLADGSDAPARVVIGPHTMVCSYRGYLAVSYVSGPCPLERRGPRDRDIRHDIRAAVINRAIEAYRARLFADPTYSADPAAWRRVNFRIHEE